MSTMSLIRVVLMRFHNLFPTPVATFNYENKISDLEWHFLNSLERIPNAGNSHSADSYILLQPEMKNLKNFFEVCVQNYLNDVYIPKHDVKIEITQSWVNFSKKNEWHHRHNHNNSFVSGVFYLNTDNPDSIIFANPLTKKQMFVIESQFEDLYYSEEHDMQVCNNLLILFPSWLSHSVHPVINDVERISIAFNSIPRGYIGDEEKLTGLHL